MLPIAIQAYSLRDASSGDPVSVLREVKAMGYDGIELAGLYGFSFTEVKMALQSIGIKAMSAHVSYDEMIADPDKVLGGYASLGCSWVAIPHLPEHFRIGAERYDEVIAGIKTLGEAAKKHGMTLLYHNHEFEFAKIDGEYALDLLYKAVPADLLQTQLDTCWVKVAGADPAEYVRKYTGRAPVVHLKDYCMEGGSLGDGGTPMRNSTFEFRHLGAGMQDMPALVQASLDAGAEWFVVEQDMPTKGMTSIECARESLNYLRSL